MTKSIINILLDEAEYRSALRAAEWIMGTHPDTIVRVRVGEVEISSPLPAEVLPNIWRTGLANEILIEKAAGGREAVLEALVR